MNAHEGPVLDFALGRHRDEPSSSVQKLIKNRSYDGSLSASSPDQIKAFSAAAAAMLAQIYKVEVAPQSILPVAGGRPALTLVAASMIKPGETVAIVEPAYPAFERIAVQLGAEILPVPPDPDQGFVPDGESINADALRLVSMTAVNFPNNPTGAVPAPNALRSLFDRLPSWSLVFNDATYGPLTFDGSPWTVFNDVAATFPRLRYLELHSLSKLFGTGPLPVSFLVGEDEEMTALREFSEFASSAQSALQVEVATECLKDTSHLKSLKDHYFQRMAGLGETLETLGFEPLPVSSGMYLMCRVPMVIGEHSVANADEAAQVLLDTWGVAVVPWEIGRNSYLRFSARYTEDELAQLRTMGQGGLVAKS
ncbi:MAG: pyridoxal phosphate-dependent aminotransferase [bacterium]|nr:pyridoxal phosphate-dependent aminotransferase [bacterium]